MTARHLATRHTAPTFPDDPNEMAARLTKGPPALSPTGIQFSSDSRALYVFDREHKHTWSVPDLANYQPRRKLPKGEQGVCRFLNNRKSVLLIRSEPDSEEGIHHVAIRDLKSNALKADGDIRMERYGLFTVLFNSRDDQLLLQDYGQTGYFFAIPSMHEIGSIRLAHSDSIIFSPDESQLWTIDHEYLRAVDAETGKLLRRKKFKMCQSGRGLQLVPSKRRLLVVRDKTLRVLDSKTWKETKVVDIPTEWGLSQPVMAFSPDAKMLALSSDSTQGFFLINCRTWKVQEAVTVDEQHWSVKYMAFSPNGRSLACATWGSHNEVRLWSIPKT